MTTYTGSDFWSERPSAWPTVPLRKVARLGTGHTPSRKIEEYWRDCRIPWVTTEDLTARTGTGLEDLLDTRQKISELGLANSAAELHPAGTVMLSRTASIGHVARVGIPMATTQAFVTWTCGPKLDPRYLTAVLVAMNAEFHRLAYGSTHLTIYIPDVEQLRVPLPPLAEQRAIADYLDAETARIDALITKKQQLATQIMARRQATMEIELDRYRWAPLRRFVSRVVVGIAEGATHAYADRGIPLLRSMNIRANRLELDDLLFIEPWFATQNRSKKIQSGDVLTVRTGSPGVSAVATTDLQGAQCFTQLISTPAPGRDSHILSYGLNSRRGREYFDQMMWGSAQQNISVPILAGCPVPDVPGTDSLKLKRRLQEIDQEHSLLCGASQQQISLLVERRRALVTAAVTGEFKVPGVV